MTRLGCYLTSMNGDVRKPEIAAAQGYFAAMTRAAEVAGQRTTSPVAVEVDPIIAMCTSLMAMRQAQLAGEARVDPADRGHRRDVRRGRRHQGGLVRVDGKLDTVLARQDQAALAPAEVPGLTRAAAPPSCVTHQYDHRGHVPAGQARLDAYG